jgi:hypothetical protein
MGLETDFARTQLQAVAATKALAQEPRLGARASRPPRRDRANALSLLYSRK